MQSGILIEEKRLTTAIPTEVIRFLNYDLYTYFIFLQITEKFKFKPSLNLFEYILITFKYEILTRSYIINWAIRFCISRNQAHSLKYIFELPFNNEEKNNAFDFICYNVQLEYAKPNSQFKVDLDFMDLMVTCKIMSANYKKTIKLISENILDQNIQILINLIESNINIIELNKGLLHGNIQFLKRNYKQLDENFPVNPYDLANFFYNSLLNKTYNEKEISNQINKLTTQLYKATPAKNNKITSKEILCYRMILALLFTQKNYNECYRFAMGILNKYPNILLNRHSIFSPFLLVMLCFTCIKLMHIKEAQKIILFLDKIITTNYTHHTEYIDVAYYSLKASFYIQTKEYEKALNYANKAIAISYENDFYASNVSLLLIKIEVLRHLNFTESVSLTIEELLNYIKTNRLDMPEYVNIVNNETDNTFNVIKSYITK